MNARVPHPLGIIPDMPAADYHAIEAMSNTRLKDLAKSPAHFYALHRAPGRPERKTTDAMKAGTLAHCLILETEAFTQRYALKPAGHDGRTKEGKAWLATIGKREAVSVEQYDAATMQSHAVQAVPELAHLLSRGKPEMSAFWTDGGVPCKCRPDWVHPLDDGRVILLDLKTCPDVSPTGFAKSVWNFGYHRQAAHYTDGWEVASGQQVAAFVFAAVTNEYPFLAVPYLLDDEAAERGRAECARLMDLYAECEASGAWPLYGDGVQTLSLPAWA